MEIQAESQQDKNKILCLKSCPSQVAKFKSNLSLDERLKLIAELKESLQRIDYQDGSNRTNYKRLMDNVGKCLIVLCKVGASQIDFTDEEKIELGTMVQRALPSIAFRIEDVVLNYPPLCMKECRWERSGLQFLFDDYKDFPIKNDKGEAVTLYKEFIEFRESEDVEEWDECLKDMDVDHFLYLSPLPEKPNVPSTHWWFTKGSDFLTGSEESASGDSDEGYWKIKAGHQSMKCLLDENDTDKDITEFKSD